ncbi:MAG: hypothetical protein L3J71_16225 [Victivallaceae bacterium]|nr:hypothetical protein [Victivallaceae bacterium]
MMKLKKNGKKNEKGIALIFSLVIVGLLLVMALSFVASSIFDQRASLNAANEIVARGLAQSAVTRVLAMMEAYDNVNSYSYTYDGRKDFLSRLSTDGVFTYNPSSPVTWELIKSRDKDDDRILGRVAYVAIQDGAMLDPAACVEAGKDEGLFLEKRIGVSMSEINLRSLDADVIDEDLGRRMGYLDAGGVLALVGSWLDFTTFYNRLGTITAAQKAILDNCLIIDPPEDPEVFALDVDGNKVIDENSEIFNRFNLNKAQAKWDNMVVSDLLQEAAVAGSATPNAGGLPWLKYFGKTWDSGNFVDDESLRATFASVAARRSQIAANLIDYSDIDNVPSTDYPSDAKRDYWSWRSKRPPMYTGNEKTPYINEIGAYLKIKVEKNGCNESCGRHMQNRHRYRNRKNNDEHSNSDSNSSDSDSDSNSSDSNSSDSKSSDSKSSDSNSSDSNSSDSNSSDSNSSDSSDSNSSDSNSSDSGSSDSNGKCNKSGKHSNCNATSIDVYASASVAGELINLYKEKFDKATDLVIFGRYKFTVMVREEGESAWREFDAVGRFKKSIDMSNNIVPWTGDNSTVVYNSGDGNGSFSISSAGYKMSWADGSADILEDDDKVINFNLTAHAGVEVKVVDVEINIARATLQYNGSNVDVVAFNTVAENGLYDKGGLVFSTDILYEMSDMDIVTVSGGSGHSNNGHGNNVDGVDSSNPGNSKEGEDSDPNVDDEIKGGSVADGSGNQNQYQYQHRYCYRARNGGNVKVTGVTGEYYLFGSASVRDARQNLNLADWIADSVVIDETGEAWTMYDRGKRNRYRHCNRNRNHNGYGSDNEDSGSSDSKSSDSNSSDSNSSDSNSSDSNSSDSNSSDSNSSDSNSSDSNSSDSNSSDSNSSDSNSSGSMHHGCNNGSSSGSNTAMTFSFDDNYYLAGGSVAAPNCTGDFIDIARAALSPFGTYQVLPGDVDYEKNVYNPVDISTNKIRNGAIQSPWELGFIHRAAAWQTINLKKFDSNHARSYKIGGAVGKYAVGDANILDQIKMSDAVASPKKVDLKAFNRRVFNALLDRIKVNCADTDMAGTNSGTEIGNVNVAVAAIQAYNDQLITRASVVNAVAENRLVFSDGTLGYQTNDAAQEEVIGKFINLTSSGRKAEYFTLLVLAQAIKDVGAPGGEIVKIKKRFSDNSVYEFDALLGSLDMAGKTGKNGIVEYVYADQITAEYKIKLLINRVSTTGKCRVVDVRNLGSNPYEGSNPAGTSFTDTSGNSDVSDTGSGDSNSSDSKSSDSNSSDSNSSDSKSSDSNSSDSKSSDSNSSDSKSSDSNSSDSSSTEPSGSDEPSGDVDTDSKSSDK